MSAPKRAGRVRPPLFNTGQVVATPVADDRLLDMDEALAGWAADTGLALPRDIGGRMALHLSILGHHLEALGETSDAS